MRGYIWRAALAISGAGVVAGCSTPPIHHVSSIPPGAQYVAMGSSFAAGPGVTTSADQPRTRCARSNDNFAHLVARRLDLKLTDVSCSGATTEHVLGPWKELPAQMDALTADTRLVTITIGGNDVGYFNMLWSASCAAEPAPARPGAPQCPLPPAGADAWQKVETGMRRIALEVHRRAPAARLIFVDYLSALPPEGTCATAPMTSGDARAIRSTARRLARLTARIAAETGSDVLKASSLSRLHNACSRDPWINGFRSPATTSGFVPYHPNKKGMAAIADFLLPYFGSIK
ncbi:MAG: SGNH/GDSL hydrolase family protein [Sphingobium sp.]